MPADDAWTDEEQKLLEDAMMTTISILDRREKWKAISAKVGSRSAKACAERFQRCRELIAEASPAPSEGEDVDEGRSAGNRQDAAHAKRGTASSDRWQGGDGWSKGASWEAGWNWSSSSWSGGGAEWKGVEEEAEAEEEAEEKPEMTEAERRAVAVREEVERNRLRAQRKEELRQKEEQGRAKKQKEEAREREEKRLKYIEEQEQKRKEAFALDTRKREEENERKRKAEEARQKQCPQVSANTNVTKGVSNRSANKMMAQMTQPRSWASKMGSDRAKREKQKREEEQEAAQAEVLANIAAATGRPAVRPVREPEADLDLWGEVEDLLAEPKPSEPQQPRPAPKRAPIGPRTARAKEEEEEEDWFAEAKPSRAPIGPSSKGKDKGKDKGKGKGGNSSSASGASAVTTRPVEEAKLSDKKMKKPKWWHKIDGDCPISLALIADLPVPPFALEAPGSDQKHHFDARFLAHFLVSSFDIIDPVNRRKLTREECEGLDAHVLQYYPSSQYVSVVDAYDLLEKNTGIDDVMQRDAAEVLRHLFRFGSSRRTDALGRAVNYQDGGLTVVDDDDILAADPRAPVAQPTRPPTAEEQFPSLPGAEPTQRPAPKPKAGYPRGPPRQEDVASFPTLGGGGAPTPKAGAWGEKSKAAPDAGRGRGKGGRRR